MKDALTELIFEFYERTFDCVVPRSFQLPELPRNATVITGMRRTGKTFRVYQQIQELQQNGIELNRILYLNFDDDRLDGITANDLRLIPDIYYQAYPDNRQKLCYFFFDEIQDIDKWEPFIRRLIDSGKVQVYLTGSSSKLLSSEIATSMRGRSLEVEVFPLSFEEYLRFHHIMDEIPVHIGPDAKSRICNALDRYFQIGGFPDAQNIESAIWSQLLQGYANEVMFHDVVERYRVTNLPVLRYILRRAFHNPGGKLSASSLHKDLHSMGIRCDRDYITQYIDYFCQAYILYQVPFYTDSLSQERVNPAKYYLVDTGMIRAMSTKRSLDNGPLLENLIYLYLRRKGYELKYLVTKKGYEVDFIAINNVTKDTKTIQVCYDLSDEKTFAREVRPLADVREYTNALECLIITWDSEQVLDNGVKVVPAWKFLLDRY